VIAIGLSLGYHGVTLGGAKPSDPTYWMGWAVAL
jgi:hypothetical protein